MSVRECRLVTQWCEFLCRDGGRGGVNKWYLRVYCTRASPLVFLVCLVAPYFSCAHVISSPSWGVLRFRHIMRYSSVRVRLEHCVW